MSDFNYPSTGFHHITVCSGAAQDDIDFFTQVLGQRLIKQTILFDGRFAHYHLYYANAKIDPGTVMTSFPYNRVPGRPGAGQVSSTSYSVGKGTLPFWVEHLNRHAVEHSGMQERFGQKFINMKHPAGLGFEVMEDSRDTRKGWEAGDIPAVILVRNGTVKLARPVDQVKIPATVEGILAARIDRLPLADKEFLQTLAVIGREFPRTLAREAADLPENRIEQMLSDLQAADFIFEEPAVPDTLYSFKHALTQEVAYNSVLSERRKALHERIAGRIEALFAARLDDHLPELAYHYARGGNPLKAIEYLGRAADQSARRTEYADAIDHLEASLRTIETLPEGPQRDRLEIKVRSTIGRYLIPLKGPAADEVRAAFERARELCQKLGDTEDLFWIAYGLQFFHMLRLELATARELGMQQLTIAERVGDPAMRMSAYVALGQLMFTMGEFSFAEELCERI